MKWGVVRAGQLGDNWSAEHHLAQQEGLSMTEEEERLNEAFNRVFAWYSDLRYAAGQVAYAEHFAVYDDDRLRSAIARLRELSSTPLTISEKPR